MKERIKKWLRIYNIRKELRSEICESVGMMWWQRARNYCNRLDRVNRIIKHNKLK